MSDENTCPKCGAVGRIINISSTNRVNYWEWECGSGVLRQSDACKIRELKQLIAMLLAACVAVIQPLEIVGAMGWPQDDPLPFWVGQALGKIRVAIAQAEAAGIKAADVSGVIK